MTDDLHGKIFPPDWFDNNKIHCIEDILKLSG
jgi:hypothetical protein